MSYLAKLTAATVLLGLLASSRNLSDDTSGSFEVTSLLGRKLYALPDDDGAVRAAKDKLAADPRNMSLVLALSKTQAAKRQYKEAVATCTAGLEIAPDNSDLLLERGHRELGLRQFQQAEADLNRAVDVNPKSLDEYYHLGLAHYFLRQFDQAADSFRKALDLAQSNDSVIDCSNWLYVSLRRANKSGDAAEILSRITPDVQNKEPHLLFYLKLLHFYQGKAAEHDIVPARPTNPNDIDAELAFDTISYGLGNWHLYNDHDQARADQSFRPVVAGNAWNSWGFIGSEIELAKKGGK
jgi:tetratricopeptide (TPR) repeat protein